MMSDDFWCSAYWAYEETTCVDLFANYTEYDAYYPDGEYVQYFLDYFGTFDWQGSPTGRMIDSNSAHGKYQGYAAYLDLSYAFSSVARQSRKSDCHSRQKATCVISLGGPAKTPYRDGTTHVIFEPLDFIARLAALARARSDPNPEST